MLRRDVAATVLRRFGPGTDPDDDGGAARAQEIIARALRSGSFEHPGCARLLDVLAPGAPGLPDGVLGAAVAEWVPGLSLAEAVADGMLKPLAAARALQPLAAAAEAAHRHGHVLGCDHPQRIRLNHDGRLQLGFALPRPELTPADDVRGLGAALYTLLTALWPLSPSDAARAGLRPAERGSDGTPLAPSAVRPGVPVELETLVVGTLGTGLRRRAGAHRRRGAQRRRRGRGGGGPRGPVPARARRGAAGARRRLAAPRRAWPSRPTRGGGASWPSGWPGSGSACSPSPGT